MLFINTTNCTIIENFVGAHTSEHSSFTLCNIHFQRNNLTPPNIPQWAPTGWGWARVGARLPYRKKYTGCLFISFSPCGGGGVFYPYGGNFFLLGGVGVLFRAQNLRKKRYMYMYMYMCMSTLSNIFRLNYIC